MNGTVNTSDRRLLADVHRWARTNGWATHRDTGWQNPDHTVQVDWDERGLFIGQRDDTGRMWPTPRHYPADSIRQAVDLLAALDILPARLSSAYRVGHTAGFDAALELATATAYLAVTR